MTKEREFKDTATKVHPMEKENTSVWTVFYHFLQSEYVMWLWDIQGI